MCRLKKEKEQENDSIMGEWVARREKCIKSADKRGFQQAVWLCM